MLIRASLVPEAPAIQRQPTSARNERRIRFVQQEGNENDIWDPFDEYPGRSQELQLDHGDLASLLVAEQVMAFLALGQRTCDRNKKHASAEECYDIATQTENNNTLFLIPDFEFLEGQDSAESGAYQVVPVLRDIGVSQASIQPTEGNDNARKGPLDLGLPLPNPEDFPEDCSTDDVLGIEQDNAANSYILQRDTTLIYLKKRVEDSYDVSKPADNWQWTNVATIEVPMNDPRSKTEETVRELWNQQKWKPHDCNLRTLAFEDCYRAAMEDSEHILYLMMPPSYLPWTPQASIPLETFSWNSQPDRRRFRTPSQPQKPTGLGDTVFHAPPNVARMQFPGMRLIRSTAENHRDKLVRGPDQQLRDGERQNRVGWSFQEEVIQIRKTPAHDFGR